MPNDCNIVLKYNEVCRYLTKLSPSALFTALNVEGHHFSQVFTSYCFEDIAVQN